MYKFIHNPHQRESRDLLQQLLNDPEISSQLEVIDFMEARKKLRFRATPTLWKIDNDKITVELEEKFTVEDVKKAKSILKNIEPSEEEKQRLDALEEKITIFSSLAKLLPEDDLDKIKLFNFVDKMKKLEQKQTSA